jgi:DNA invertase Pin-like site-specific DNA recombinase
VHGSIATQLQDCRQLAENERYEVVDPPFSDEAASAYKGNRGPGLDQAKARCIDTGAALVVQHSDRLARGDGRHAKHLLHYALWAVEQDIKILSVQDPQTFGDLLYAAVTGQRNHEDSKRKSEATKAGKRRQFERGRALGPLADGYKLEHHVDKGLPGTRRVLDPERAPLIQRMMGMVEAGNTYGAVARTLNGEGLRTQRATSGLPAECATR